MSKAITFTSRNEMFLLPKEWPKRDHLLGLALSHKLEGLHSHSSSPPAPGPEVGKQILAEDGSKTGKVEKGASYQGEWEGGYLRRKDVVIYLETCTRLVVIKMS